MDVLSYNILCQLLKSNYMAYNRPHNSIPDIK